jgi:phage baseplate assembly protein gpV
MANQKGKLFDDGVWRYYDQQQHKWITQEVINAKQKAEGFSNVLIAIGGGA